jgi:hypothetical protein
MMVINACCLLRDYKKKGLWIQKNYTIQNFVNKEKVIIIQKIYTLKPLSLTPSRLPRFPANGQNFKTFSKRERNGKDPSRASDQGNDSKT